MKVKSYRVDTNGQHKHSQVMLLERVTKDNNENNISHNTGRGLAEDRQFWGVEQHASTVPLAKLFLICFAGRYTSTAVEVR